MRIMKTAPRPVMKTCPWCEGRRVTGRLAHSEEPDSIMLLGRRIPVIGAMLDVPCGFCDGLGYVPANQTQEKGG